MSRRRFFAPPDSFDAAQAGGRVPLSADESRHLRDVLRLRAGDEAFLFDGEGREYRCRVAESGGNSRAQAAAVLEVCERVEAQRPESPLRLSLLVGLLKGEKFDLVVQKATELGVARIVPVLTKRADVRLGDAKDTEKRVARWRRLALEAAKQSGRARVPRVEMPCEFKALLTARGLHHAGSGAGEAEGVEACETRALRLLFAERGGQSFAELPAARADDERAPLVEALTGSEGGWESSEIDEAREAGWHVVTLGGRTLRAETAAVTVAALLQHRYGDLT